MTTNQIAALKLQEESRHNQESEDIERDKAGSARMQARAARFKARTERAKAIGDFVTKFIPGRRGH